MVWLRYVLYVLCVGLVTWLLTQSEIWSPGTLRLHAIAYDGNPLVTSEYSPIEVVQPLILAVCGILMGWVSRYCPSQRPVAIVFGGLALIFLIGELDYFFDRYLIENLWLVLITIVAALLIVYTYRQQRRLRIAMARIWPSPGLAVLFAGAVVLFAFVPFVGSEKLWMALLGADYRLIIKLAVEEFIELSAYLLWIIGTIEYAYQARAIAFRQPQPAAQRLRQKRRHDREGEF